jgi:hypothetical protein
MRRSGLEDRVHQPATAERPLRIGYARDPHVPRDAEPAFLPFRWVLRFATGSRTIGIHCCFSLASPSSPAVILVSFTEPPVFEIDVAEPRWRDLAHLKPSECRSGAPLFVATQLSAGRRCRNAIQPFFEIPVPGRSVSTSMSTTFTKPG